MRLYLLGLAQCGDDVSIVAPQGSFAPDEIQAAAKLMASTYGCDIAFGCTRMVTVEEAAPLLGEIGAKDFVHTVFDLRKLRS